MEYLVINTPDEVVQMIGSAVIEWAVDEHIDDSEEYTKEVIMYYVITEMAQYMDRWDWYRVAPGDLFEHYGIGYENKSDKMKDKLKFTCLKEPDEHWTGTPERFYVSREE